MRGKLVFVAGLAAGYVLGARAGRPAYEAISDRWQGFRENPTVQRVAEKAKTTAEEKAPALASAASKVAETAGAATSATGGSGSDDSDDSSSGSGSGETGATSAEAETDSSVPTPKDIADATTPSTPAGTGTGTKTGGAKRSTGTQSGAEQSSDPSPAG
ncbi:hypothetical protein [Amnibacterium setariae]|uniref:YtxH domain-containing protein n=1 Tax=Amnibacterium setariae TaxID=2306585 RepID=A0A3A1TV50_9MICO|nr:hypothetical protein [Amnibacterium setariae]RIX27690.1 hypothetical protein D1781_09035 [Amnibacterium setariae]